MDPTSAVAKGGERNLLTAAYPQVWCTKNTAFVTSRKDKTTDNDGIRNNYV